jgi:tetratricopeptide (TPR) repeat protein
VRHPDSRWAEEAQLLRGTAYVKLRDCQRALEPLESVMMAGRNPEFVERAAMLVGSCRLTIGDPLGASSAYARLLTSRNAHRRDIALWAHGRSLRLAGDYETAAEELAASEDPRARGELAAAHAALGRVAEALALVDSLIEPPDSTAPWLDITWGLGRVDLDAASALTTRVAATGGMPAELRARLLAADAGRLAASAPAKAERRLFEAESVATGTLAFGEIALMRVRSRLREETDVDRLREQAVVLADYSEGSGALGATMLRLAGAIEKSAGLADSVHPGQPLGDMRLFLAAEMARDSAELTAFAEHLFARIPDEWPDSPYGAKAVMALIGLAPEAGDSLTQILSDRFAASPYVAVAGGGDGGEILALEDSLRRFGIALSRPSRQNQPGRPGQRPRPQPTRPAEDLP